LLASIFVGIKYYFFGLALIYSPLGGEARINIKYDITQA
jgi:hypothetical protein